MANYQDQVADLRADLYQDQVADLRADLSERQNELDATRGAWLPLADALERVDAFVDQLGAQWAPHVGAFAQVGARMARILDRARGFGELLPEDVEATLAALVPHVLKSELKKRVQALYEETDVLELEPTEKRERTEQLRREIYELEVEEEGLVIAAAGAGVQIPRRAEASPHAVLGLPLPLLETVAA